VKPNTIVFSAAISACASAGEWKVMATMFDSHEHNNCTQHLPRMTCDHLLLLWLSSQPALKLLDEMKERSIARNSISYNAAIKSCWDSGAWEQALQLLQNMEEHGIERDRVTFNAAIRACERAGQIDAASRVRAESILALKSRNPPPEGNQQHASAVSQAWNAGSSESQVH